MAPTISSLRISHWPVTRQVMFTSPSEHLADAPKPCFASGRVLSWNKPEPGGKIAAARKAVQIGRKCSYGTCGHGADTRHGAEPTQILVTLRGLAQFFCQLVYQFGEAGNLRDIKPADHAHSLWQVGFILGQGTLENFEVGRSFRRNNTKLSQMPTLAR